MADLADRYLEEHVAVRCKPKTQRTARSVVNRHIVPALGKLPIAAVEPPARHGAARKPVRDPRNGEYLAVETLSHMYALARGWDMAPEDCDDPCEFIPMNPKRKRERFLTDAEFTRLGHVLDEVSGKGSRISAGAIATIRLLMLTGLPQKRNPDPALGACRSQRGRDSSRRRENRRPHGPPVAVGGPRPQGPCRASPAVPGSFRAAKPGRHMTDIDAAWKSIRAQPELRGRAHP